MKHNHKVPMYANYKRKNKWLGMIDYPSLLFLVIYMIGTFSVIRILPIKIEYTITIFCVLVIPVVAVFCVHVGSDSVIDVLRVIAKYVRGNGIYIKLEYYQCLKKETYGETIIKNKKSKLFPIMKNIKERVRQMQRILPK